MDIYPELATSVVVRIEADGKVSSLYKDSVYLGFLGDQKIRREAEIVFDNGSQTWHVFYCGHESSREDRFPSSIFGGFTGYEEAREFEVTWLNHCYLQSIAPDSDLGIEMAVMLRDAS